MSKYRIRRFDNKNIVLEKFYPSVKKPDGNFTQEAWRNAGYYGKWQDAIQAVLNQKICPVGDDLETQLRDIPAAIERAKQEIIDSIEIVDNFILIS